MLNQKFINSAMVRNTFNIPASCFSTLQYKNEIRKLILTEWFPELGDMTGKFLPTMGSIDEINYLIESLKVTNLETFEFLFSYHLKGIGAGEILSYFLIDNARIAGGSSSAGDIIIDDCISNIAYEVKSVEICNNHYIDSTTKFFNDFKVGGSINLTVIMQKLTRLFETNKTEISAMKINSARNTMEFEKIEQEFRNTVANYFNKYILFFANSTKRRGDLLLFSTIKKENIFIDRVTANTIKPLIKLEEW